VTQFETLFLIPLIHQCMQAAVATLWGLHSTSNIAFYALLCNKRIYRT